MSFSEKIVIVVLLALSLMGIGFPTLYSLDESFQNKLSNQSQTTHEEELLAPTRTIDFLLDGPGSSNTNTLTSTFIVLFFSSNQTKEALRGINTSIRLLGQYASCRPDRLPTVSLLIFPYHEFV